MSTTHDHVALTLAIAGEEPEAPIATRKSIRRTWNQLPRCQRNLIILAISLLCLTLFLLLPGEQMTPAEKLMPMRQRAMDEKTWDVTPYKSSKKVQLAEMNGIVGPQLEESKQVGDNLLESYKKSENTDKPLLKTTNYLHSDIVKQKNDADNVDIEDVMLQKNNDFESPLQGKQHEHISEIIKNAHHVPGTGGVSISEFIKHMDVNHNARKQHFHGANNARQTAVVGAFKHAWNAYRKYAWGHDHLLPISRLTSDWFNLGLTIVDSLDTMYIMGLEDEFSEARDWVSDHLTFNGNRDVNLFEVTIRVLGGLLSTYHLSGDKMFLAKSIELGNRLLPCFLSPSGIPYSDVNLGTLTAHSPRWSPDSSTSEVTTLQLEFRDLSRSINVPIYEQISNSVNDKIHGMEKQFGLVPIFINANSGKFHGFATISLGARGDSYYEYLLKQWIQTGRKEDDNLIQDYMRAIDGVLQKLVRNTPRENFVYIGELTNGHNFKPKMDHLTCYLPGTLLLGHKYGMPDTHLQLAKDLLNTCYQMYMKQPTHLSPEIAYFALNANDQEAQNEDIYVKPNDAHNLLRPEFIESLYYFYALTGNRTYQHMGWQIFEAFENYTKVDNGYTSIGNVKNALNRRPRDKMESFWLGETLKYFYLLFSDNRKEIDLDKWVFNTEAHPLPIREH